MDRHRTRISLKHIAIAVGIGIVLVSLTLLTHVPQTATIRPVNTPKSKPVPRISGHLKGPTSSFRTEDFQDSDFYHTIIDNNLFRPLGWRPPRRKEPYRLLGTILPTHGDPQAILQATAENKIYTVPRGNKLDADTTITDIQAKQVTLERAGQRRTLKLNPSPWLK